MNFLGDFECSMDDKGRVKLPAALRRQFPEKETRFMLAKDIEDCLVIYPMKTWQAMEDRLRKLNPFNVNHQRFINVVTTGLAEVEIDSADRFLISTGLRKYLGSNKAVLLKGKFDKIQVWDASRHEQYTNANTANVETLADEASKYLDRIDEKENNKP